MLETSEWERTGTSFCPPALRYYNILSYHNKKLKTVLTHSQKKKGATGKNVRTFFSDSAALSDDAGILVYIGEPEASAKICVYVFILMRVFIQIYFWILFTRSKGLWLFPLHMNLIWGEGGSIQTWDQTFPAVASKSFQKSKVRLENQFNWSDELCLWRQPFVICLAVGFVVTYPDL